MDYRNVARGVGAGVACAAGIVGTACALVAPRRQDAIRASRWAELARFRYAHRGLYDSRLGIPENSLPAFERARRLGFGSELDVHLTADGELAVIHDSDLRRMTGAEGVVEERTLAQLETLRLDGTEHRIPTFGQVLATYAATAGETPAPPLVVEVKTLGADVVPLCERTLSALDAGHVRYCVESFDPRVLLWLRRHRPDVIRGQLSQDFVRDPVAGMGPLVRVGATYLLADVAGRPDFVAYRFRDLANPALRLATGPLGGRFVSWTLKSQEELDVVESLGGVGIFEGFVPDRAHSQLSF